MLTSEVINRLKGAGNLSKTKGELSYVNSGMYALNKILSGDYKKGYAIGRITEIIGDSSTGKTVFLSHLFREAQKKGYYTILFDVENTYNMSFAEVMGVDPDLLIYPDLNEIDTIPTCFDKIEKIIKEIRETDSSNPIVIGVDSVGAIQSQNEADKGMTEGTNLDGAVRAKEFGRCLRKINSIVKQQKVCLVIINQYRINPMALMTDPRVRAGGGNSLFYYADVSMGLISNKTSDLIKDEKKNVIGIKGKIKNLKNKLTLPFQSCDFTLYFDKGLVEYDGVLDLLDKDGLLEKNGGWYTIKETGIKFQNSDFVSNYLSDPKFEPIKKLLSDEN